MTIAKLGRSLVLCAALGLGACATTDAGNPSQARCRPDAAAALVGQAAPDNATILRQTNGIIVRRLAPGGMATKDFREERVTVTIVSERITAAACG